MFDYAVYNLLKNKGWKNQSFLISGTFTAPVSGLYFINGCGGGAAGRVGSDSSNWSGGGSGESVTMLPFYLSAGTSVPVAIGAGGTGDGGSGGNTSFGSYITLYGGGVSGAPGSNFYGGGSLNADNAPYDGTYICTDKIRGANATQAVNYSANASNFINGKKGGTYMWGGAGSKYGVGGDGNASGAGSAGGIGAGGGSGTTAAGPGGVGYLDIMWQE